MKVIKYKRGQIWWYKLNNSFDGSVMGKTRPVILISNDLANQHSTCLLGVPVTTSEKKDMPTHTTFEINGTLSTSLAENLMSINTDKLTDYIGTLDDELLNKVENNILVALGLNSFKDKDIKLQQLNDEPVEKKPIVCKKIKAKIINEEIIDKTPKSKPGRKSNITLDDKIRFINDYENHDSEYMLKKYNLKDKRALAQKAYIYRKDIKEN